MDTQHENGSNGGRTPTAAPVIRIRDAGDLEVLKAMMDRHEKGTIATVNTIEAFGGDKHALDHVLAVIHYFRREVALQGNLFAPTGDATLDGTPMAGKAAPEVSGVAWSEDVPTPRPATGQFVRWPTGETESIVTVLGWQPDAPANDGGFFVVNTTLTEGLHVVALLDETERTTASEWRILGVLGQYVQRSNAPFTDDATAGTVSPSVTEKLRDEVKRVNATTQRERNLKATGAVRPVPKPGASKNGAKGKSKGKKVTT